MKTQNSSPQCLDTSSPVLEQVEQIQPSKSLPYSHNLNGSHKASVWPATQPGWQHHQIQGDTGVGTAVLRSADVYDDYQEGRTREPQEPPYHSPGLPPSICNSSSSLNLSERGILLPPANSRVKRAQLHGPVVKWDWNEAAPRKPQSTLPDAL